MPPSLVANRGERAKRVTFIARETSGNEAETDGDGTRQGLMRLLAPAKQTEKKITTVNLRTFVFSYRDKAKQKYNLVTR